MKKLGREWKVLDELELGFFVVEILQVIDSLWGARQGSGR